MIEVTNLSVDLAERQVLADVSMEARQGELLGVIGPNGAGKTTLLRTVAGIIDPATGSVLLDGDPIETLDRRSISRRVAVVPQTTSLSFDFSVEEVVAMGRTPYHGRIGAHDPHGREIAQTALERTGIAHLADRPITAVSGGERQRVLIARALAQDTPALLLDEPTANLDINHQLGSLDLIAELVAGGKTGIAAIHDLELAARYCDRLLLLAEGAVLAIGSPADVLQSTRLRQAFDADVAIRDDPITGSTSVTPMSDSPQNDVRIAILGHGNVASPLVRSLDRAGYELSVGIVRPGDQDGETATGLGHEVVEGNAAGPLPEPAIERMRALVQSADITVLADVEVDSNYRPLLGLAEDASRLIIVEDRSFAKRNHAGPTCHDRYESLSSVATVTSSNRICECVQARETGEESPIPVSDRDL